MKYDSKAEILVFQSVKELGEGTREEIHDYVKDHLKLELSNSDILRYLHKFKARKVFSIRTRDNKEVWAIAEIPPWYASGMMDILKKTTNADMKTEIEALNERLKDGMAYTDRTPVWTDYRTYELTFENLDMILGGHPTNEDRETAFPRRGHDLIVPSNWLKGWVRDNQPLVNCVGLQYHVALGNGEFLEQPATIRKKLKVKTGLCDYEAIEQGAKFKVTVRLPMKGSKLKTEAQWKNFFGLLGEAPIRGLGANPAAFGGRAKLLEMKEISQ